MGGADQLFSGNFYDGKRMKLTEENINAKIATIKYDRIRGTTTTLCILTLQNGFVVVGKSACVDPAEFDHTLGESIALDDAVSKVWELEGYLLAQKIFDEANK